MAQGRWICQLLVLLSIFVLAEGAFQISTPGTVQENLNDTVLVNGSYTEDNPTLCPSPELSFQADPDSVSSSLSFSQSQINSTDFTFNVTVVSPLDYEQITVFVILLTRTCAGPGGDGPIVRQVTVVVENINDTPPFFADPRIEVSLPENSPVDTVVVGNISAVDSDAGDSVYYKVDFASFDQDVFTMTTEIEDISGAVIRNVDVFLKSTLDYETNPRHEFTIIAEDLANLTSTCEVVVMVQDVQDTPPRFTSLVYNGRVSEAAAVGTIVLTVTASDGDSPAIANTILYSILEATDMFTIDTTTGDIRTSKLLDIDNDPSLQNGLVILTVLATESNSSSLDQFGEFTSTTTVQIQVEDANDNPPTFNMSSYTGQIREDAVLGELVSLEGGGYILVSDRDQFATNNQFSIHVEKDGARWSMFKPNVESQYSQASILLKLNEDNGLMGQGNTHITFQLVATDQGPADSTLPPSVADITVWVSGQATAAPVPEAVVDLPLSTSDIIVFVVGFLLLLNVCLTVFLCYVLRGGKNTPLSVFNRNSKYYVSKKKDEREDVTVIEDVVVERTEVSGTAKSPETVLPTPPVSNGSDTIVATVREEVETRRVDTVAGAADRNRCDVTVIGDKLPETTNTDNRATSAQILLGVLEADNKRCDVTPLKKERQKSQKDKHQYVNVSPNKNISDINIEDISNKEPVGEPPNLPAVDDTTRPTNNNSSVQEGNRDKCEIIPMEQSSGLSNLLHRVQEKLSQGKKSDSSKTEDDGIIKCDVRPLDAKQDSLNSSFSDKSTGDIVPLIKESPTKRKENSTLTNAYVNPAFKKSQADKAEKPGQKIKDEGKDKIASKSRTENQPTSSPISWISPRDIAGGSLTQTGVPPIALALPSSSGNFTKDHLSPVTNPVFEVSTDHGAPPPPPSSRGQNTENKLPPTIPTRVSAPSSREEESSRDEPRPTSPTRVTFANSTPPSKMPSSSSPKPPAPLPPRSPAGPESHKTPSAILKGSSSLGNVASTDVRSKPQAEKSPSTVPVTSQLSKSTPALGGTADDATSGSQKDFMTAARNLLQEVMSGSSNKTNAQQPPTDEKLTKF